MDRPSHATRFAALASIIGASVLGSSGAELRAQGEIDLGDIVKGGDGLGTAPGGQIGIDPVTGEFVSWANDVGHDFGPPAQPLSPFIDSVFILGLAADPGQPYTQAITQSGITYDFPGYDATGHAWGSILGDRNTTGTQPPAEVAGRQFPSAVGMSSAMGITFSLAALREAHGDERVGCFSAFWGMNWWGGDVNMYAIFSSESEGVVLEEPTTFHAASNTGQFIQIEIPSDADYLTLVVGSNWDWSLDAAAFASPTISASPCPAPTFVSFTLEPPAITLNLGETFQMTATAIDTWGIPWDLTAAATGTTYEVSPTGVATVGPDGLLTAVGYGTAEITVRSSAVSGTATVYVQDFIDLGCIVSGSDGKTPTEPGGPIGILPNTGAFAWSTVGGDPVQDSDSVNPQPVDGTAGSVDSPFIESVFVLQRTAAESYPDGQHPSGKGRVITLGGATFDFSDDDIFYPYEAILDHREAGGAPYQQFGGGPRFYKGIGMHSSKGITFDLDELRSTHGDDQVRYFSAVAGSASGCVNAYAIFSDGATVLSSRTVFSLCGRGEFFEMPVPPDASRLTLATGAGDEVNWGDNAGFGIARLNPEPVSADVTSLSATPNPISVRPGGSARLNLTGTVASTEVAGLAVSIEPSLATYLSADPSIAAVDADGTIRGVAAGETTVEVVAGSSAVLVTVVVKDIIDLGDIVGGGDGSGTAPPANTGIDPRSGGFTQDYADHIVADPMADPVRPTSSDLIDAVFFLGSDPDAVPPPPEHPQEVTRSGVEYLFPYDDCIGQGWNYILRNRCGGVSEPTITVGGRTDFASAVGIHAAAGITFDLAALRRKYGDGSVGVFRTTWGLDIFGDVNMYILFSDDSGVIDSTVAHFEWGAGAEVEVSIPTTALYLTLATGARGSPNSDHGTFADPYILPRDPSRPEKPTGLTATAGEALVELEWEAPAEGPAPESFRVFRDGVWIAEVTAPETAYVDFDEELVPGTQYCYAVRSVAGGKASADSNRACATPTEAGGKARFRRGDANADGEVNITDGIYTLNFLFLGGLEPPCAETADADNDAATNITDGIYILNYLFLGGGAPPSPGPDSCGIDPDASGSAGDLGCASYEGC